MNENNQQYNNLIDSHFHLTEMGNRGFSIPAVLQEMKEANFSGALDIAMTSDDHLIRKEILKEHPFIRIASGIGPWWIGSGKTINEMVDTLKLLFKDNPPDAIGEFGLDFFHNYGTVEEQKELCRAQIELSRELKLPIVVHVREADEEMMSLLNEYSFPYSGIIHCFSSDMKFADFALSKNFLLSFAGPITYKKNVELREVLKHVPLESLLLETDSPFLAPQDKRGKPNTPLYISSIYEKAAEVKEVEVNTIIEHINKNFFKLLKKN